MLDGTWDVMTKKRLTNGAPDTRGHQQFPSPRDSLLGQGTAHTVQGLGGGALGNRVNTQGPREASFVVTREWVTLVPTKR